MNHHPLRAALGNAVAFTLVIVMNALANALPLNGQTTGQVSASYRSLFTPAGFTFGIWGIIYLALLAFIVYQFLPRQRTSGLLRRITPWFLLSCVANALWIVAWHWEQIALSLALMLVLLFALLAILRQFEAPDAKTPGARVFVVLPFSIYGGWITLATIANFSALQTAWGWNDLGMTAVTWTQLKLAAAALVAAWVALGVRNVPFVLVVAWAAHGIASGQAATPEVAGAARMLMFFAIALCALSVGQSGYRLIAGRRHAAAP
ncbi:MAG: tryptophan-rich sensory protein [Pseudomonadota bacterium]